LLGTVNFEKYISAEALTTGRIYTWVLIVHQQRYRPSDSNKGLWG